MARVTQHYLDARRRQILDAASRCFVRNGFHATSMQDILGEAELSSGAVYRYFKGKDEIVGAIAAECLAGVTDAFETAFDEDPLPPLPQVLTRVFSALEESDKDINGARLVIQVYGEAIRSPELRQAVVAEFETILGFLTRLVTQYQERGTLPADVSTEHMARVLHALIPGFLMQIAVIDGTDAELFENGLAGLLAFEQAPSETFKN